MEYRYSLRRGSRKDECPGCGHRTYKPYVDADGNECGPGVGRCDRENSCRYHLPPAEYFALHPGHARPSGYRQPVPRQPEFRIPALIDGEDYRKSLRCYDINSLAVFLRAAFSRYLDPERVDTVLREMGVGTSRRWGGSPVFWQIDHEGRIRDGKVMGYDRATGHRIKNPHPQVTNAHTLLASKYKGEFKPCFFGAHQLATADKRLPIWLFESEKAAVIATLAMECSGERRGVAMASGGCAGFNPTRESKADPYHRIQALRDRWVILFPDQGKFIEWRNKADGLRGFSKYPRITAIMEQWEHRQRVDCKIEQGDGFDDVILRYLAADRDLTKLLNIAY